MAQMGRPVSCSSVRRIFSRVPWSCWVPWLKLSRKTSTPASNKARIWSGVEVPGPSVATILVERERRTELALRFITVPFFAHFPLRHLAATGAKVNGEREAAAVAWAIPTS